MRKSESRLLWKDKIMEEFTGLMCCAVEEKGQGYFTLMIGGVSGMKIN